MPHKLRGNVTVYRIGEQCEKWNRIERRQGGRAAPSICATVRVRKARAAWSGGPSMRPESKGWWQKNRGRGSPINQGVRGNHLYTLVSTFWVPRNPCPTAPRGLRARAPRRGTPPTVGTAVRRCPILIYSSWTSSEPLALPSSKPAPPPTFCLLEENAMCRIPSRRLDPHACTKAQTWAALTDTTDGRGTGAIQYTSDRNPTHAVRRNQLNVEVITLPPVAHPSSRIRMCLLPPGPLEGAGGVWCHRKGATQIPGGFTPSRVPWERGEDSQLICNPWKKGVTPKPTWSVV